MFNKLFGAFKQEKKVNFASVCGHDDLKDLLQTAIHASAPVHPLLVGPPGCGKTELCKAVEQKYETIWLEGKSVTIAGLLEKIKNKPKAKIIVYNEIDKAKPEVIMALLEIMENGRISKTTKTESFDFHHSVWVIATSNRLNKIPEEIQNRMIVKKIEPYTAEEFIKVGTFAAQKENITADIAKYIAEQVLSKYGLKELRKCKYLARMSKTIADVDKNIGLI